MEKGASADKRQKGKKNEYRVIYVKREGKKPGEFMKEWVLHCIALERNVSFGKGREYGAGYAKL